MNWFTNRFNQPAQPAKPKDPPVRNEWPEPEDDSKPLENEGESSEAGGEHGEGS